MENTKKKVNKKPMLIAGIAMLLALVGCVGGITYSKYVSSKAVVPSTQATVAKWGYVITGNVDNKMLFSNKYVKDADTATAVTTANATTNGVIISASSGEGNNVVAPGVTGSTSFTIIGQAEVASEIKLALNVTNDISLSYTETGNTEKVYKPIAWTLTKTGTLGGTNITAVTKTGSLADIDIAAFTEKINPNVAVSYTYTLSYVWVFDGKDVTTELSDGTATINGDTADTILGKKAAGETTSFADGAEYAYAKDWDAKNTLDFSLTASVTQVQEVSTAA